MADEVIEQEATALGEVEAPEQGVEDTESEPVEVDEAESQEDDAEEAEESQDDAPEEAKPEQVVQNGRNLPDSVKKLLALGKTSNPEGVKIMRATWFQNQDYKAAFATPADAQAMKQKYEEIGGDEGLQAISSERQEWDAIDQAAGEGKAAEMFASNPELIIKNTVGFINEWAKVAPEQYAYYANTVAVNTIQNAGVPDVLAKTYEGISGFIQQNPELKPYIDPFRTSIADAYNKIVDISDKAQQYQQKRTDPREEQLKQKETAFEDKRRADFEGQVYNDALAYRTTAVDKAIMSLLNGRKADPDQMDIYREKVSQVVEERLGKVEGFERQLEALYRTGDRAKSVEYIKRQIDSILGVGKAVNVIDPLLRNINPQKPKPVEKTGKPTERESEPGTVNLPEMPNWDRVDWGKTSAQEYAQGSAVLVNGKKARW